jgi:hypothetical protein
MPISHHLIKFITDHAAEIGISLIVALILGVVAAVWRWGRRALVAILRWFKSVNAEAQSNAVHLSHPLLIQLGDRRQRHWYEGKRGDVVRLEICVELHITNNDSNEVQISAVWLYCKRSPFEQSLGREGDLSLTDPLAATQLNNGVFPPNRMMYGFGRWSFEQSLAREPERLKVRVCIVDQLGRKNWSELISVPWVNEPGRSS